MSTVKIATSKLTALANAVRGKSGESEELTLNDIPTIIPSLATPFTPPTLADGTWEDIARALSYHKSGKIDLYTTPGWEIGATRTVSLSAMPATGVGESHVAQDVTVILMDKNVYDLADGSGKCIFTWELKGCLADGKTLEKGYMNPTDTNAGGWDGSARRTWCNNVFYNALPASFKALVPQVKVKTSAGGDQPTTIITSNDYCFLRSLYEVYGQESAGERIEEEGPEIKGYDISGIGKAVGLGGLGFFDPKADWLLRSSTRYRSDYFYYMATDGEDSYLASAVHGIAPCGCI